MAVTIQDALAYIDRRIARHVSIADGLADQVGGDYLELPVDKLRAYSHHFAVAAELSMCARKIQEATKSE